MEKFYLELPSIERKNDALEYINEFYEFNSEIHGVSCLDKELKKGNTYEEWLNDTLKMCDEKYAAARGWVSSYSYFLTRIDDNRIVGMINLRTKLNKYLRNYGGHIGTSIRPTERRKGYNKINLYLGLLEYQKLGLKKVLITCADYNVGSRKSILALGGKFEKNNFNEEDNKTMELYWIDIKDGIEKFITAYGVNF